ncbi:MAG: TlpA family protein disulfide reductase [Methylocystis sp.]|nr:TlpA family protein disulfide reductase [Methylocystis sp.]
MNQPPPNRSPLMFLKAGLVTIAVGVGLIYGIGLLAGKKGPGFFEPRDPETSPAAASGDCAASTKIAAAVNDFATGEVASMTIAKVPAKLANYSFAGPDGKEQKLGDFLGKTVLLNLWASWCVPCRDEMPALDRLQGEKGSDKFQVVAINVDTAKPEKAKAFLEEAGVKNLTRFEGPDLFFELKQAGKALGLPTTLLIGPDGCQIGLMNGPAPWDSADGKALIGAALSAAP